MIYSPVARSVMIGPSPCMTPYLLHLTSLYPVEEKTTVRALCFVFTKHFIAYKSSANALSCLSSILTPQEVSTATVSCDRTTYFHCCDTFHWSLEVICDLFALHTVVFSALSLI